jgi:adenine-specific DNA methylase
MPYRKKLIEVALPLEEINKQSAREKPIRHDHPYWQHTLVVTQSVGCAELIARVGELL